MLYRKNITNTLSEALFRNPTSEYRGTPFWAWNCRLDQEELYRQIDILQQMGFGGFHMHCRIGLDTPYLSDEFMQLIRGCVDKAEQKQMLAWLYDEDRWPSGFAGGIVTKDISNRARFLRFTPFPYSAEECKPAASGGRGSGRLIACFDVALDEDGCLESYRKISEDDTPLYEKWYAYLETEAPSGWYNNQTYVNTLDKKAMDQFIQVTYEGYNQVISDSFGKTVPAIFTDEPQFSRKSTLGFAHEKKDVTLPWTDDLPDTFFEAYGEDLVAGIPELFWELPNRRCSVIRYHYHDHVCQRFTEAFADNCGAWCREHGIMLTGHMMEEPTLKSQTAALGEAMRAYRGFDLPGIDILCASFEFTTAKQAQSAVHQFGREGMLSELYGVTNWDFDFRGHKLHGDWQAALGVTVRVPHLSWVSMAGEAKRDYPASINYQSPWWKKYSAVENHFARVNTAMTRGKPLVKVGVIHPVESYWLHWGPSEQTALIRDELDENFQNLTKWLLFGSVDFDYISESLLPDLAPEAGAPLRVGQMAYDVILVPGCETLRSTTLDRLEAFQQAGGRLVFAGNVPYLENAVPSDRCSKLCAVSEHVSMSRGAILQAVESARIVELRDSAGNLSTSLLHQIRQDGDGMWLFIAHGKEAYSKDLSTFEDIEIRVAGCWKPTLYNTLTGETTPIAFQAGKHRTVISYRFYEYDSLLLRLDPTDSDTCSLAPAKEPAPDGIRLEISALVPYSTDEPNVLLMDKAEYALDDEPWHKSQEILLLSNLCRKRFGWPAREDSIAQPWVIPSETPSHRLRLRFRIQSEIDREGIALGIEDAETLKITWNGQNVIPAPTGWYVDRAIDRIELPPLVRGENILEVEMPFGPRTNVEWVYLLGDFGVRVLGSTCTVMPKPDKLAFGTITDQGFPFYGGNLTYHIPFQSEQGNLAIKAPHYLGALIGLSLDDNAEKELIYPPYWVDLGEASPGPHQLDVTLYGHRRNSFGPVHNADLKERWIWPGSWRTSGDYWTDEYRICQEGILSAPAIFLKEIP